MTAIHVSDRRRVHPGRHRRSRVVLPAVLSAALLATPPAGALAAAPAGAPPANLPPADAAPAIQRKALRVDLGDWTSRVELTYPAAGHGRWPTVVLFHGSGPSDLDATQYGLDGKPRSANFRTIAEHLSRHGFAVLRFDKRGVRPDGGIDLTQVNKATTNQLIQDAGAVIAFARQQPEVDGDRLALYGWSQGAQVAVHAAVADGRISQVVSHGGPSSGWQSVLRHQFFRAALPGARRLDADRDGRLSRAEMAGAELTPTRSWLGATALATDGTIRPDIDTDRDGQLSIEGEWRPVLRRIAADPAAVSPFFDPANEPARQIADAVRATPRLRVFALHGSTDGWVPYTDTHRIHAAAPDRVTARYFTGLGHALSPATRYDTDSFGAIAAAPLLTLTSWLSR